MTPSQVALWVGLVGLTLIVWAVLDLMFGGPNTGGLIH